MATLAEARTLQNYVAGRWVDAEASDALDDRDPATGELAARIPLSGAGDVDAAVRAARAAQPAWRGAPPQERGGAPAGGAGARRHGPPRCALAEPRGDRRTGHRGHGQDARGRRR